MAQQNFELTARQKAVWEDLQQGASHYLLYGGSRSGKTFLFCYAVATRAMLAPKSRHVILRKHNVAVRQSIGLDTFPKVMELAYPGAPCKWYEQHGYFIVGDGSEIWLGGLDDKERVDKILGKEYATIYINEASEVPWGSYEVAQTRLAQVVTTVAGDTLSQRCYVDLNPTTRQHWTYKLWVDGQHPETGRPVNAERYRFSRVNPTDNMENLTEDYIESLQSMSERQRKRFFEGEFSGDAEGALWRRDAIRYVPGDMPSLRRIVVAVDPAVSTKIGSDETGLVVAGVDSDGQGYVLADESGRYSPQEWARRAVLLFHEWSADRIVGEVNQGGEMVEDVLRQNAPNIPYKAVRASRGKVTRAEPIAAIYERGKVYHRERFPALEDQMCSFTSDFDPKSHGYSPDRVDALVWAFTELFPHLQAKVERRARVQREPKPSFF